MKCFDNFLGGGSKKRPAWDLKGRLQDMESKFQSTVQERHDLMTQMNMYNERIALLENKNTQLSGTVQEKEQHSSSVSMENDSLRKQLRYCINKHSHENLTRSVTNQAVQPWKMARELKLEI